MYKIITLIMPSSSSIYYMISRTHYGLWNAISIHTFNLYDNMESKSQASLVRINIIKKRFCLSTLGIKYDNEWIFIIEKQRKTLCIWKGDFSWYILRLCVREKFPPHVAGFVLSLFLYPATNICIPCYITHINR